MVIGQFDSPIAAVAYDAAHVSFYSVADWGKPGTYDDVLVKPLRQAIRQSSKNLFIVLHTMGSHANYANRYPPEFDVFTPSLKDIPEPDYYDLSLQERVRDSYDNSILFTDHVIAEVIRTLASTDAISTMWYVSDHGEDFASKACKLGGHGNGTVNDFRIPSVFWYSDAYATTNANEVAQARIHSTMKLTTESIFESLIDMAGLDFPAHDHTHSIFSAQWRKRPRVVVGFGNNDLDFDDATVSAKCEIMLPGRG
jgi:glucan phosphoethanolaminetransferase (alkaline phosphatase superfamily)